MTNRDQDILSKTLNEGEVTALLAKIGINDGNYQEVRKIAADMAHYANNPKTKKTDFTILSGKSLAIFESMFVLFDFLFLCNKKVTQRTILQLNSFSQITQLLPWTKHVETEESNLLNAASTFGA